MNIYLHVHITLKLVPYVVGGWTMVSDIFKLHIGYKYQFK